MNKNIVIFSDGTAQEGGKKHNTNVYKLFNMIEDRTFRQTAFYDTGVGTDWRKLLGNAFGVGLSENMKQAYKFIFNNFKSGDNIFLFGFSRGAATVRSLSYFIHLFGILPYSRPELIEEAFDIYKTRNKKRKEDKAKKFIDRHHTMWTKIKFLGVWDTVAALGFPVKSISVIIDQIPFLRHRFHNFRLSESVIHARQALAIDDERLTFHPILWDRKISEDQTLKQVWFSGMHTDVGGGYKEQSLSDIPLSWITKEAMEFGLRIYPKHKVELNPDADGFMHDSRGSFFTQFYRKKTRKWNSEKRGLPVIHQSAIVRKKNRFNKDEPEYSPWIFNQDYEIEKWNEEDRNREEFYRIIEMKVKMIL